LFKTFRQAYASETARTGLILKKVAFQANEWTANEWTVFIDVFHMYLISKINDTLSSLRTDCTARKSGLAVIEYTPTYTDVHLRRFEAKGLYIRSCSSVFCLLMTNGV